MIGIYKITNLINGHAYIGQSKDIERRWQDHQFYSNDNTAIHTAFKKYGIKNFSFEIIEECSLEELDKKEIYWIKFFNTYYDGYNETLGGQGGYLINREEVISDYNKTKSIYKTASNLSIHRQTVSKILENSGIKKQDVSIKSIVMINPETLQIEKEFPTIVDASNYIKLSDSAIRKALKDTSRTSGGYYWDYKDSFDPLNFKKKQLSKKEKSIAQYSLEGELLSIYPTIKDALIALNKNLKAGSNISQVCKGKRKSAYGYIWKYLN